MLNRILKVSSLIRNPAVSATSLRPLSTKPKGGGEGDDEWNNAWESAWLPEDLSAKNRAHWETDVVNFSLSDNHNQSPPQPIQVLLSPEDVEDADAKAFVEDMVDSWDRRRGINPKKAEQQKQLQLQNESEVGSSLYSLENVKRGYRLKKQRIQAGLWVKEIEKQEEAKLGDSLGGDGDDFEKLLDSCSE